MTTDDWISSLHKKILTQGLPIKTVFLSPGHGSHDPLRTAMCIFHDGFVVKRFIYQTDVDHAGKAAIRRFAGAIIRHYIRLESEARR